MYDDDQFGFGDRYQDYAPPEDESRAPTCTDTRNARRFAMLHENRVRYCHPFKSWIVWDERRWRQDDTGAVWRLAREVSREILREAAAINDKDVRDPTVLRIS